MAFILTSLFLVFLPINLILFLTDVNEERSNGWFEYMVLNIAIFVALLFIKGPF